jgi:DNA-binding FadR family transcriptional regulator
MSRLHRNVMRILLADMVAGVFAEGAKLPKETDLVEQFSVSRGVVRESLRSLEERGVIAVRHGSGATVCPQRDWDILDGDVLAAVLEQPGSTGVLREFLESRRILEVQAAMLAAERASDDDIARLGEAMARIQAAAERNGSTRAAEDLYHQADLDFHGCLLDATANRVLAQMVRPIRQALEEARRALAHPESRAGRALPEHQAIYDAIAARDPEAAGAAMRVHLDTVAEYLDELDAKTGAKTA